MELEVTHVCDPRRAGFHICLRIWMFQECFEDVSRIIQGRFEDISGETLVEYRWNTVS